MDIDFLKKTMQKASVRMTGAKKAVKVAETDLDNSSKKKNDLADARILLQVAVKETQDFLKIDIERIVTAALAAIPFKSDYSFIADFVTRRNTTECDLYFSRNGRMMSPLDSCGYGAADIASFALRVAYVELRGDLRKTILCDEPFHNLDKEKHPYAAAMMQELSQEFSIQFIISSHEPAIIESADKIFYVSMENEVSIVTEG